MLAQIYYEQSHLFIIGDWLRRSQRCLQRYIRRKLEKNNGSDLIIPWFLKQSSQILGMNFDFTRLTSRKKIVIVLALLTGLLHFLYGVIGAYPTGFGLFDYIFVANLIGNIFFVVLLYFTPELDEYHTYIRWGFILYTMSSIFAYFYIFGPGGLATLLLPAGVFDKLLEVILIIFLLLDRPLEKGHPSSKNTTST